MKKPTNTLAKATNAELAKNQPTIVPNAFNKFIILILILLRLLIIKILHRENRLIFFKILGDKASITSPHYFCNKFINYYPKLSAKKVSRFSTVGSRFSSKSFKSPRLTPIEIELRIGTSIVAYLVTIAL